MAFMRDLQVLDFEKWSSAYQSGVFLWKITIVGPFFHAMLRGDSTIVGYSSSPTFKLPLQRSN